MIGTLVAIVWFLRSIHLLLAPIILALLLAYLVSFPVGWILRHTGWPRTAVVAFTYVLVLVLIATAPVLVMPRLVSLLGTFSVTLVKVLEELAATNLRRITLTPSLTIDPNVLLAPLGRSLKALTEPGASSPIDLQSLLFPFASGAAIVVRSAVSSVLWIFVVLMASFYVAKDGPAMGRWLAARFPEPIRPEAQRLWHELSLVWDAFVRGQVILSITMGVLVWLVMSILGQGSAPALGLLSGLAEFVPGVGPVAAAVVGIIIALILGSSWLPVPNIWFAAVVAATYFLLSQIENLYLLPRVVGRRIALHPIVVIVGAFAGAELGGVLGILLAAPTIACIRILFGYIVHKLLDEEPFPPIAPPPDQTVLWQDLMNEHPVCAILFDLDGTLIALDDNAIERLAQVLGPAHRVFPNADLGRVARHMLRISTLLSYRLVWLLEVLRLPQVIHKIEPWIRQIRGTRSVADLSAVPGSIEMLRWLSKRYRLGIVTSRPRVEVSAFLTQYNLGGHFRAVITSDDVPKLKPHPLPVQMAARQLDAPADRCVVVCDTTTDVRAAKGAGMLCIGVLSGFGEENDLQAADLIINSTAQLGGWL